MPRPKKPDDPDDLQLQNRRSDDLRLLLDLIPFLQRHGGVTEAELAALLQCSPDEVQSLLDRVLMCGLPPYQPGDYVSLFREASGKIFVELADHFRRPVQFSLKEVACLRLVLQDPLLNADPAVRAACESLQQKLDRVAPRRTDDAPVVHVAGPDTHAATLTAQLQDAIRNRRRVRLRHFSSTRFALAEREVSPWQLRREGELVYLAGFEHSLRNCPLLFRLDRIESVTPLDTPAEPPPDDAAPDADGALEPAEGKVAGEATIRISSRIAPWVREQFGNAALRERVDGDFNLHLPIRNPAWVTRFVLAWGEEAELLAPPGLRHEAGQLLRRLRDALSAIDTGAG